MPALSSAANALEFEIVTADEQRERLNAIRDLVVDAQALIDGIAA